MDLILLLFIKGVGVGFAIAAPIGPVGILCIRRTLMKGMLLGALTGLAAAVADAAFGAMAAFGISFIAEFMKRQQYWLQLGGGILLLIMGAHAVFGKWHPPGTRVEAGGLVHDWIAIFALTITNPITIVSVTAVFVAVGINTGTDTFIGGGAVVLGVFLGSALWWTTLSASVGLVRGQLSTVYLKWLHIASGVIMLVFGAGVMIHLWI